MQLGELIGSIEARFEAADLCYGHGTDNARDEAIYLAFETLGISYSSTADVLQRPLTGAEVERLEGLVVQRVEQQTPVAYLVGAAWFAGSRFLCDERALVPRSPIAELIDNSFAGLLKAAPDSILDLCCGGGCIGIASALKFPDVTVDLVDISADALALAEENIKLHDLDSRVSIKHSDLFSDLGETYDMIVSNPPYVSAAEFKGLPAEYHAEPSLGLLSAEEGLQLPLRILQSAAAHLREGGILIMEVGSSAPALQRRLPSVPLLWLEFAYGGDGVFSINREQLEQYADDFSQAAPFAVKRELADF